MKRTKTSVFDAQAFLDSTGEARRVVEFQRKATIFAQGNSSKHVMYIQKGGVKALRSERVGQRSHRSNSGTRGLFSAKDAWRGRRSGWGRPQQFHLLPC